MTFFSVSRSIVKADEAKPNAIKSRNKLVALAQWA